MRLLVFFLFIVYLLPGSSQEIKKISEVPGVFDFARVDNFGKVYLIKDNELKMYSPDGKLMSQNSDKFLGSITDVDATNGLELLVFFEDQVQVLFLDNQLGVKGRDIPLDALGLEQVSNACNSYGNGVWLFDKVKFELLRLDKNNKFTASSGNLNQLLGYPTDPVYMRESNNWLYLLDRNNGVLVFDIYGAYYKTIPVKGFDSFQVSGQNFIHYKKPYLMSFDMKELMTDTILKTEGEIKQVTLGKNRINYLNNNGLSIYEYRP